MSNNSLVERLENMRANAQGHNDHAADPSAAGGEAPAEDKKFTPAQMIEEHHKRHQNIEDFLAEAQIDHAEAYITALKKHARPSGKGRISYSLLDSEPVQLKVAKEMEDFYVTKLTERLGLDKGKMEDLDKRMLLQAYGRAGKEEIRTQLKQYGRRFNMERFNQVAAGYVQNLEGRVRGHAVEHIEQEVVPEVLKEMVKSDPDMAKKLPKDHATVRKEELAAMLQSYKMNDGKISPEIYRAMPWYKEPEAKDVKKPAPADHAHAA